MTENDTATTDRDPAKSPQGGWKTRDRALILTLLGCFLLLPPLAGIFQLDFRILGVPFTALYLFAVWGLLIAGTAWLARPLRDSAGRPASGTEPVDIPEAKD